MFAGRDLVSDRRMISTAVLVVGAGTSVPANRCLSGRATQSPAADSGELISLVAGQAADHG
jgi:hypothetical protein